MSYKAGVSTEKKERDRAALIAGTGSGTDPLRLDLGGESRDEAWGATVDDTSTSQKLNSSLQGLGESVKEVERERGLNIKLQATLAEKDMTVIELMCFVYLSFVSDFLHYCNLILFTKLEFFSSL